MVLAGYLLKALLHTDLAVYPGVAPNAAAGFVILGLGLLAFVRGAGHLTWSVSASPTRGILLGGTCLLLFALLSTIFTFQFQQDHQWVSHTQEVLKEIESMTRSMGDLVSSARGYLVSAEEHLLAQRAQSQAAVREHFAVLRGLTADNPRQQRRLDRWNRAHRSGTRPAVGAAHRPAQAGRSRGSRCRNRPRPRKMPSAMTGIRVLLKEMRDDEYDLLDRRSAQTNASASRTFLLLPLGLFLSLTTLCVALFFLNAGVGEAASGRTLLAPEAHEKLRSSEENLRLMISGVKDYSILTLDPDGLVATWNLGAQRLKGWSAEEIIGQHFSRFYSREEAADHVPHRELEIAKAEGQFVGEGWRIRKRRLALLGQRGHNTGSTR